MKLRLKKAVLCSFVFIAIAFFAENARPEEVKWKIMGKTRDNNWLVYYNPSSVKYIRPDFVSFMYKRKLSPEGIERYKKDFYKSVKEAEEKAGEKTSGPLEPILNALIERETKEYVMEIDCTRNEIMAPPAETQPGNIGVVVVDNIEPGTSVAKIRDEVCTKH